MSQNDMVIANQTAPNFRADLNLALQALASTSSGSSAPATTYANMLWYDTSSNILKMRTEADDAWIEMGSLDQSNNTFVANVGLLDEDNFSSDSATAPPSQQSTAAYIDTTIPEKLNASGSAPIYACRAWVNFNGTGTVAIRASGNVSSITDNGTGRYTVNFTTALEDADYSVSLTASQNIGNADTVTVGYVAADAAPTASSFRFYVTATNFAASTMADPVYANVSVFR